MQHPLSRRTIGKLALAAGAGFIGAAAPRVARGIAVRAAEPDRPGADTLGWTLGCQAWTFRDRACDQAIRTVAGLGLTSIELYPGQPLAADRAGVVVGPGMSASSRDDLEAMLKEAGVRADCFGVAGPTNDESRAGELFEFARAMGIGVITMEPEPDAWDVVERLAEKHGVQAACHNHPKPSRYWEPAAVLKHLEGRGPRLGVCADVGHWVRSGLVPVEGLRACEGRLVSLHLKDTDGRSTEAHKPDVSFGKGTCDMPGMLAELKRQGFRGVLSIEHETGAGETLEREVAESIAVFDRFSRDLIGS
jgi:sugar phosphate isomerase/epimerase